MIHYIHNGGMVHAVPDLDVSAGGSANPENVTCSLCREWVALHNGAEIAESRGLIR